MTTIKSLTLATGLVTSLILSSGVLADCHGGGKSGRHAERVVKELQLDEQQQALFTASHAQRAAGRQQNMQLREQLRTVVHADTFDSAAAEKIAEQMANTKRAEMVQHASAMNAFYRSLNTDQRAKLEQLEQQRKGNKKWDMQEE
jgi:Spy/CpxP family protein refolding chaperone